MACPGCARQVDASGRRGGERFRCACGTLVTVPEGRAHPAAVVRCSACGAPREGQAVACTFCGSDFTLAERDLDTLCPGCMARISRRARYCHHCALPIVPQGTAGEGTPRPCPACGAASRLTSRGLGGPGLSVLECGRCGGLWLGKAVFRLLEEGARRAEVPGDPPARAVAPIAAAGHRAEPLYRPCAECGALMHRRNYGRRSGVIVDVCARHGLWFDRDELDAVLAWIREGGWQREAEAAREAVREEASRQRWLAPAVEAEGESAVHGPLAGLVGRLLDLVLR